MGAIVTVLETLELERSYNDHRRFWVRKAIEARAGWLVGYRTVFDGTIEPGFRGDGLDGEYDPPYLKIEKSHRCMLVAFTPYSKPVHVPLDGFDELATNEPHAGVLQKDRELLSREAKNWPRDAKGRFSK